MYTYTAHELRQMKKYFCYEKAKGANYRFEDKIIGLDVLRVLERFNFKCIYCLSPLRPTLWQLDHFYSKAMGGKNKINNLAPSCKWCNQMKGALDGHAFILKCKSIVENNILSSLDKIVTV